MDKPVRARSRKRNVGRGCRASRDAQTIVHTFTDVPCVANVSGTLLTQTQDITIAIVGPASVNPGDTFTLTFPGGPAGLATRSNGLNITSYSNLFQVVQINGTNFNPGIDPQPADGRTRAIGVVRNAVLDRNDVCVGRLRVRESRLAYRSP